MHLGIGCHVKCTIYGGIKKHVPRGHVFEWETAGEIRHWPTVGHMARKRLHPRTLGRCGRSAREFQLVAPVTTWRACYCTCYGSRSIVLV